VLLGGEKGDDVATDGGQVAGHEDISLRLVVDDPVGLVNVLQHGPESLESRASPADEGGDLEDTVIEPGGHERALRIGRDLHPECSLRVGVLRGDGLGGPRGDAPGVLLGGVGILREPLVVLLVGKGAEHYVVARGSG
jgi:hypothetical protein